MAEQTFNFAADEFLNLNPGSSTEFGSWRSAGGMAVDADLSASSDTFLYQVGLRRNGGQLLMALGGSGGSGGSAKDLSDEFESNGSVEITVGVESMLFDIGGLDTSETYVYDLGQSVLDFMDAIGLDSSSSLAGTLAATVTLRDFVPSAPSFADDTGDAISGEVGTAITSVTVPAAAGGPAPTYAVVGTLPAGLDFDETTRVLSGTPGAAHGSGTITNSGHQQPGNGGLDRSLSRSGPTLKRPRS